MGYFVTLTNANAILTADKAEEAYRRMCELNKTHHAEKRGGSFGGTPVTDGSDRWFSWMDANYPETCNTASEILDQLGFQLEDVNDDGDFSIVGYDSKTGQEELFIEAISDLFPEGSFMEWRGEDGHFYRWELGGKFADKKGRVVYD